MALMSRNARVDGHKLSAVAQYDDMCRKYMQIVDDAAEEESLALQKIEQVHRVWSRRMMEFKKREDELNATIEHQKRDIKDLRERLAKKEDEVRRESKLKERQLAESRSAQSRYMDETKALKKLMAEVGGQLINRVSFTNTDSRDLINRLIGFNSNLPTIPASEDSSDGVSIDYDKTEESMHGLAFEDNGYNDPTLLCRPVEMTSDESDKNVVRFDSKETVNNNHDLDMVTSESDDNNVKLDEIEQEIKRLQEERQEKMTSTISTPAIKQIKSSTYARSANTRSATSLHRTASSTSTPLFNMNKPHSFVKKRVVRPEICQPCGERIGFFSDIARCEHCQIGCHTSCKDKCPPPCVPITTPSSKSAMKMVLVSDYVGKDAYLKVPAIIIHCCNEIERRGLQEEGLYRVCGRTQVIEDLQNKILRSKNGIPNLEKVDVHVLCGVVKRFLMTLDESLLTKVLWREFVRAADDDDPIERNEHLTRAINDMPLANLHTLAYLMQHFHTIASKSSANLMTVQALAKAVAPTIVGNSVREPPPSQLASESKKQGKVMEALFSLPEEFWSQYVCPNTREDSLGSRLYGDATTIKATSSGSQPTSASTPKRSKRSATLQRPHLAHWV